MRYPDKSHSETGSRMWFPGVEGKGQWGVSVSWRVSLGEKEKKSWGLMVGIFVQRCACS